MLSGSAGYAAQNAVAVERERTEMERIGEAVSLIASRLGGVGGAVREIADRIYGSHPPTPTPTTNATKAQGTFHEVGDRLSQLSAAVDYLVQEVERLRNL